MSAPGNTRRIKFKWDPHKYYLFEVYVQLLIPVLTVLKKVWRGVCVCKNKDRKHSLRISVMVPVIGTYTVDMENHIAYCCINFTAVRRQQLSFPLPFFS